MSEKDFIDGEREIRKKYNLLLLVELANYYYKNADKVEINTIVNSLQDAVIYDSKEREELLKEARKLLKEKYSIDI